VNAGYVLIGVQIMHTRLLSHEKLRWYGEDVGLPLSGALGVAVIGRVLFPASSSLAVVIGLLAVVSVLGLVVTSLLTPITRTWLWNTLRSHRSMKEVLAD
jgi:hypothetical protein